MKKLFFVFLFLSGLYSASIAQYINEGIYLSASDFTKGKISFSNNQSKLKYKLYINEIFHTSFVKIIKGDSIILLKKDSIFGYCDEENNCFRFYNKNAYKIINPQENILLYSRISSNVFQNTAILLQTIILV